MVEVKAGSVDAFLARKDPGAECILVYGPDSGLVNERAAALAKGAVDDPEDAFALVRLDGDTIASDPSRLVDEAHTMALFGGKRAIWVRLGTRPIQTAVTALLNGPPGEARVVIEAGELRKGHPLRALCEKSPRAAALPCYADNEAALARLVDGELARASLSIEPGARTLLLSLLGGDRLATRGEVEKLILYAQGKERVTEADVEAAVADASDLALDDVVDALFAGRQDAVERGLSVLEASGVPASAALGAALRHGLQLHRVRAGSPNAAAGQLVQQGWPGLHFRRRPAVETALSNWTPARLDWAVDRLAEGLAEARRAGSFGETLARRAMDSVAAAAQRRGR